MIALTGLLGARSGADPAPRAHIELPKAQFEAGTVTRGTTLEATFPIHNAGDAPLELEMKSGCGCFVTAMDREVAPGATSVVKVQLHTIRLHGELEKNLRVATNDPDQPLAILTIHAVIAEPLEFAPGQKLTLPLERGRPVVQEVRITGPEALEIENVTTSAPFLHARVSTPATPVVDERSTLTVEVTTDAEAAPAQFAETVTLTTKSALFPQIVITVEGHRRDAIQVSPPRLRLGEFPAMGHDEVTGFATLIGTTLFHVTRAAAEDPGIRVAVTQIGAEPMWLVRLSTTGTWEAGSHKGVVRIETDDPRQPTIELPYEAEVK